MRSTELRLPQAEALVEEYGMLPAGSKVLCAVSGGTDSVCLLHLLARRKELSLVAAHFNHQLRGEESDRDEQFVRELCRKWDIPLTVGRGDVSAFARREKLSTEEAARTLRYTFLLQASQVESCSRIATAHNAGDNAETVLLHLLRGSGLHGLTGIAPSRNLSDPSQPPRLLIHPLLTTPRADIESYLKGHGLPHVEDSSNADDAFARNRVRHQLLPLMEEMNPGFTSRLTQAIPRLRQEDSYLNAQALSAARQAHWEGEDRLVIPAGVVAGLPAPLAPRCVRWLLEQMGEHTGCKAVHLEAVTVLCRATASSEEVHLPHGLIARREYDDLVLTHQCQSPPFVPFVPQKGTNPIPDAGWTVILSVSPWPGLVIRSRRTGDEITLSNGHSRSLKRLFIDRKIPRTLRDGFPVAADDDGVIFAAPFGPNLAHPRHKDIQITAARERKS